MTEPGVTAFVGDSLTASGDWQAWLPGENIVNRGADGDTTDSLLARLPEILDDSPSSVVLLIGTNDLAWRRSVEHIVRNIETVLVTVRRRLPAAGVLVQSVLPRERDAASQVRDVNRHLWQFAPTVRAHYLDLWPAFALEDGEIDPALSDDRLHLNKEGYRVWVGELAPALERLHGAAPASRAITLPRPAGRPGSASQGAAWSWADGES